MKKLSFFVLLFSLLLVSCKNKNLITLSHSNIEEIMPISGNFLFTFDQIIAPDSILYNWDPTEYIEFSPNIDGQFKWVSANELSFAPAQSLKPATTYTLHFTNKIATPNKKFKGVKIDDIVFKTNPLVIENIHSYWTANENNQIEAKIVLQYNYPVKTKEVASNFKLKVNSDEAKVQLLKDESSYYCIFRIQNLKLEDIDYNLQVHIDKGIAPADGGDKTENDYEETYILKSPYNLEISDVSTEHDGINGTFTIKTSQEVVAENLASYIKINPSVKFTTHVNGSSFTIKSADFNVENKYELTINQGLKGKVGGQLRTMYQNDFTFGELEPAIEFEHGKGKYLSSIGNKNIGVRIINVDEVKVQIFKLFENNILSANISDDYYYYDDYDYEYNNYNEQELIYEEKIKTKKLKKVGATTLLNLNFKDILPDYDGMYYVRIESTDNYWIQDGKYISFSDIGLITKTGKNKVYVFANSINTTEALSGISVNVYGKNNQLIGKSTTAADGSAVISLKNNNLSGFAPALITAKGNGSFTAMNLTDAMVETARFDVGGYRELPNGLQTYTYFERNLYRPGETINFNTIVRNQQFTSPGNLPIKIELLSPSGKKLYIQKKSLNEDGVVEGSFNTQSSSPTGAYTVNIFSSNDVLLASNNVYVEEFMPDRIRVIASLSEKVLTPDKSKTSLKIKAENLFGTPAANRNYEVEVSFKKKYFSPKEFSDYNFNLSNAETYFKTDYLEGNTTDGGLADEDIVVPKEYKNMGVLQLDLITTVFDETGRPVNKKNTLDVFTQNTLFGIGYINYYVPTNSALSIPLVAVNKDGKALTNQKVRVKIIKHEYQTVLNKSGSYFRYESNRIEKVISDKTLTLNGKSKYNFNPTLSGDYEIRVYDPEEKNRYVSESFYAYGYGKTYLSSFEVDNEGKIDISFDKEQYEVGEKAKVLFNTPFKGKLLVTVEGRDVLDYYYVNTDVRSAELSLDVKENYLPNVYISATLIKPHKESEFPLTVAHGYGSMTVEKTERKMPVSIEAPDKIRSNTQQTIKVSAEANSYVTIAVVDEGILQAGSYQTPNPYNYFYQKRALQIQSSDLYPFLLPEISGANTTGGDGGSETGAYLNPVQSKRVELVSYWSGLVKTNMFGNAELKIDVPQFSGSLRVVAVAAKNSAFGSNEANITVADPIILSSTIPRFLSPGDTAYISTNISNTTNKSTSAKTQIEVSGPLKIVGSKQETASINANNEGRVYFKVYAGKEIGTGKITISSNALGETFKEITEIGIRPAVPLTKEFESGALAAGQQKNIGTSTKNFMENTAKYQLVVSKNPMLEFGKDLSYLVQYPYGCSEQTISAVFPQLYYKDLVAVMNQEQNSAEINNNVFAAINKLKNRQLYNGSIAMWDNCDCENWWVSAYAAHFLIEAKKAGFNVDENFLESILSYLQNRLKSKETVSYYYGRNLNKKIAPKEVAYSLYVLALNNKADISLMNYYKSNTHLLANDSKYLLAAAYVLAGDKAKGQSILPNHFENEEALTQFGGSFYSAIRDEAIALNALLDIDPNNKDIGIMAKHLSDNLRTNGYYNTQERIYSLLALGKIAKKANASKAKGVITIDGKTYNYTDGVLNINGDKIKNGQAQLTVSGEGRLYYFWQAAGIRKDGNYTEEDSHLKVRKTFYNRYGNVMNSMQFKQNDLVVIKISIQSDYNSTVENVAITDMLPAGFEIENSRISDVPGTNWIKDQTYPEAMDIRDDRILFFDNVYAHNGATQNYYYVVRAVSPGIYKLGPVGADAMYNGEYHSYNGGGWLKINE